MTQKIGFKGSGLGLNNGCRTESYFDSSSRVDKLGL